MPNSIYVETCQSKSSAFKKTGGKYKDARDPAFDVAQMRGKQRVPAHGCSFQAQSPPSIVLFRTEGVRIVVGLSWTIVRRIREATEDDRIVGLEDAMHISST